ncbi:ABC 3 transporter family protein [Sterolibacterium denitrificans]|uniref:ABC 3 transporter family protein n=1 Tax=Sterolibacterium denitrificans TaxID=157592 RepID=A0A7Z7MUF8_9PROT|nr:metal ABC transporter permease [Sterolibacterium denitrificans]SMB22604.1 ABC 3 transporter family protein [Sterolibacterium denitrificans]
MNFDGLQAGILLPAFVAGLLVLATHVPLGAEVLRRGIIFMDLAIAQFAGLGIVAVHAFAGEAEGDDIWQAQAAAVGAALLGALLLRWTEKRAPQRQEALIGVSFVVAACAAILLLAKDPHGGEHMQALLVGQILWSTWLGLLPLTGISAAVLLLWFALRSTRVAPLAFYLLFALIVTASVQVVGVYLVFASLIVPALASGGRLLPAWLIGAAGYAVGLIASALFDLPAGAAIVLALAGCALIGAMFLSRDAVRMRFGKTWWRREG